MVQTQDSRPPVSTTPAPSGPFWGPSGSRGSDHGARVQRVEQATDAAVTSGSSALRAEPATCLADDARDLPILLYKAAQTKDGLLSAQAAWPVLGRLLGSRKVALTQACAHLRQVIGPSGLWSADCARQVAAHCAEPRADETPLEAVYRQAAALAVLAQFSDDSQETRSMQRDAWRTAPLHVQRRQEWLQHLQQQVAAAPTLWRADAARLVPEFLANAAWQNRKNEACNTDNAALRFMGLSGFVLGGMGPSLACLAMGITSVSMQMGLILSAGFVIGPLVMWGIFALYHLWHPWGGSWDY